MTEFDCMTSDANYIDCYNNLENKKSLHKDSWYLLELHVYTADA